MSYNLLESPVGQLALLGLGAEESASESHPGSPAASTACVGELPSFLHFWRLWSGLSLDSQVLCRLQSPCGRGRQARDTLRVPPVRPPLCPSPSRPPPPRMPHPRPVLVCFLSVAYVSFMKAYLGRNLCNCPLTFPLSPEGAPPAPAGGSAVPSWVMVCRPSCRLKIEELAQERSRLEEDKKLLEAQLERLTLQVSLQDAPPRVLLDWWPQPSRGDRPRCPQLLAFPPCPPPWFSAHFPDRWPQSLRSEWRLRCPGACGWRTPVREKPSRGFLCGLGSLCKPVSICGSCGVGLLFTPF